MPGKYNDGKDRPGEGGDYYCDANDVGGAWCTEMDLMEANTYAFHATAHKCDSKTSAGVYPNCDRGGSCFQIGQQTGQFGPGK